MNIEDPATSSYGYVMDLREPRFRSLEDFMARRIVPSFRALITAAWQLADGFLRLHSLGLCYRDISTESGGILGTQRFMAPEVVRREAVPSDQTDRYSLAVLLFYMRMGGHPLDGEREARIRCLDVPALEKLYGFEPLYIFDPVDTSNRPQRGIHDNPLAFHHLYPPWIRELFLRSFTEGLHYPAKRVRESEWRKAFACSVDSILPCGSCQAESFYDQDALRTQGAGSCWSCGQELVLLPRIRIGSHVIILSPEARLYGHHIGTVQDDGSPIADVSRHPSHPALLGLRNLTLEAWTLTRPDGSITNVHPGRSAPIASGNKINFGPATGEIRG